MSLCIRPVVETWGESLTYLSREPDIAAILVMVAALSQDDKPTGDEAPYSSVNEYNDMTVVWIQNGARFLDYLASTDHLSILEALANEELLNLEDEEEYQRQSEDIKDLCAMASAWRKSIDPGDGSLRIYCD